MRTKNRFKKLISMLLIVCMVITMVPVGAIPADAKKYVPKNYGDMNEDQKVDLKDVLTLRKYILEAKDNKINLDNADLNADKLVDMRDFLILRKYLAEWDVTLGPDQLQVSFYDGGTLLDVIPAYKGEPLPTLPSDDKLVKEDAILAGYYKDAGYQEPFYAEDAVSQSTNVYVKYEDVERQEDLTVTSFAQMDQPKDVTFSIKRISGDASAKEAATLAVKDGSDGVSIAITDEDKDGVYTVRPKDGYKEGASYELTLADGWVFDGKDKEIRTAAFSIAMKEVANIELNDEIQYIKDTDSMVYTIGDKKVDVLTSENLTEKGGSFEYEKANELTKGSIICLYDGVCPTKRDGSDGAAALAPAVYVKVDKVEGKKVSFSPLKEEEQADLYDIPDNFPIKVADLPKGQTGKVSLEDLDTDMYANMMGDEGTVQNAKDGVSTGDYISLYVSADGIRSEEDLVYAQITSYDAVTKEITYKTTTKDEIEHSMDLYANVEATGEDIVPEEKRAQIEKDILQQVKDSGFAEEAANVLGETLKESAQMKSDGAGGGFEIRDSDGNPMSDDEISKLNLGKKLKLADDVDLTLEFVTKGEQLHYNKGIQVAVGVNAEFETEGEDGTVKIELSATFVEEVELSPSVKGEAVTKEIFFIPVPVGVSVNASVDIKNYTAFSFDAQIYTVEKEEETLWEKFKSIAENPADAIGLDKLPEGLSKGLKSVKDVMDKIEELDSKIEEAAEKKEKLEAYKKDLTALWGVMESNGLSEGQWKEMCNTFEKSTVASDILDLMDLSTETGLSTEFLDGMQQLMDKYTKVLERESDWITLFNKEIGQVEYCVYGICIGAQFDFVIRSDMNIAIGSNLQYEVGKRYNFWFKVGLFKPSAGSSSMDILDEHFDFQFYVMGKLGLKAGVRAKLYCGIGSGKFASIGIATEMGPYVKLYGFFLYEYSKMRSANTTSATTAERMAGALYVDFGLYFVMSFEANAIGNLFEYSCDFLDEELPLITAGSRRYYYKADYEVAEDETLRIRDEDGDSRNGIAMDVPEAMRTLSYVDLNTGEQGMEAVDTSKFCVTFTNPCFSMKEDQIAVDVPDNTRYIEGEMTITYRYNKVAFSQYDMSVTVPVVWTNLTTEELNEYYTVKVRVGNVKDGYRVVWSKRVLKNQEFSLPTEQTIKKLIGWNDLKYTASTGYGKQKTEKVTVIDNKTFDYNVDYKTYRLTVDDIEKADGTKYSKTFDAKYGEAFDFSELASTGTNKKDEYKKFAGVYTTAEIEANGQKQQVDLNDPLDAGMIEALCKKHTTKAIYVDDSVAATFVFNGIDADNQTVKTKKGTTPDFDYTKVAEENGTDVVAITPEVEPISNATTYQLTCKNVVKKVVTLSFDTTGGSAVDPISKKQGTILPVIETPAKMGYIFDGWCTDQACTKKFTSNKMPAENTTLWAKWKQASYVVTFHVNGGDEIAETTKKVLYDDPYGAFPAVHRSDYHFLGWYTEPEGGTKVEESDIVKAVTSHTLYAHWKEKVRIPESVFTFDADQDHFYDSEVSYTVGYSYTPEEEAKYKEGDFTVKLLKQGADEYVTGAQTEIGVYDMIISRPEDDVYAKFEKLYPAVMSIKAYDENGGYYRCEYSCRQSGGGVNQMKYTFSFSGTSSYSPRLDLDAKTQSSSFTKYGGFPTKVNMETSNWINAFSTVYADVRFYDLFGNCGINHSDSKKGNTKVIKFDHNFNYEALNQGITANHGTYEVEKGHKIKVQLKTYGFAKKPLAVTDYIVTTDANTAAGNHECVSIEGNMATIDGTKVPENATTFYVYAKDNNGSYTKVTWFGLKQKPQPVVEVSGNASADASNNAAK